MQLPRRLQIKLNDPMAVAQYCLAFTAGAFFVGLLQFLYGDGIANRGNPPGSTASAQTPNSKSPPATTEALPDFNFFNELGGLTLPSFNRARSLYGRDDRSGQLGVFYRLVKGKSVYWRGKFIDKTFLNGDWCLLLEPEYSGAAVAVFFRRVPQPELEKLIGQTFNVAGILGDERTLEVVSLDQREPRPCR